MCISVCMCVWVGGCVRLGTESIYMYVNLVIEILIAGISLQPLVTLMGGPSYADLTRVTIHLVAGQVGTTFLLSHQVNLVNLILTTPEHPHHFVRIVQYKLNFSQRFFHYRVTQ